jgi:hypothetical protein
VENTLFLARRSTGAVKKPYRELMIMFNFQLLGVEFVNEIELGSVF